MNREENVFFYPFLVPSRSLHSVAAAEYSKEEEDDDCVAEDDVASCGCGAAGGGGSDDDAMRAFHGQCARQKRRSRKKYSASSVPQTRQPVKNGCAVLSVRRAVAGDGGAQALAPNFALSSLRRASERTKLIVAAEDACWPPRRNYPFCGSDGF